MSKKLLLMLVCIVLMISIGIDFQLVNASEALEGNILVARADDEEQHDPHRDRDYDDRDEDRERDHDRDDDEDWKHNKERDDEEDHHEERDHEEDRGDEDWDDADERRETEEMERREREEMEEDLDRFIPEAMQHLKKINPGLYDHIMENEEEFKPHFQDAVIHFTRMWRELDRHEEPGLEFELESFSSRFYVDILAHEFHMSKDESTRNVIRKDIHKILVDLFDIEIARREFRIQQLQMELNELKDEVRKAKATKDDQVEVYLEKVTSTSERTIFER